MSIKNDKIDIVLKRLLQIETDCRIMRHKIHEFGIMLKRSNAEQREMLRVCHTGYTNVLKAQEYVANKTDELMDDCCEMSNTVSNFGWG
jgi:predicted transcriptional regulator